MMRIRVEVTQDHLDAIDLLNFLARSIGEGRRDELVREDLSGLRDALNVAEHRLQTQGGDIDADREFIRHWLERLEAEGSEFGFATLSEVKTTQAAGQARYIDFKRHGN